MVKDELYEKINERHEWDAATIVEAVLGLGSEVGEMTQLVRKSKFERLALKPGEMLAEMSDVLHYLVLACGCHGVTLDDLARINMMKMKARDEGNEQWFLALMYLVDIEGDLSAELDDIEKQMEAMR